jgi:DNA topoisomerase-1
MAKPGTGRDQVLAAVVRLLDDTLIRVGNEEYAATNESFGLTTLRPEHVEEVGRKAFTLRFVGKGGIEHDVTVEDPELARLVRRCHELQGQDLFSYYDEDGHIASVSSGDVNDYLHETVGPDTTAKVFRTWGASTVVTRTLAEADVPDSDAESDKVIIEAIDVAAEQLRNTRAVCRQSYVHPAVLDAYRDGVLAETWHGTRAAGHLNRADRTLLSILQNST